MNRLSQWFPTLVLGTPCPACFGCFPAPTHLIQMNVSLASSAEAWSIHIYFSAVKQLKYLLYLFIINYIYVIVNSRLITINRTFLSILNVH